MVELSSRRDGVVATLRRAGCVFAEDEAGLLLEAAATAGALDAFVRRRVEGEPLEYILGWTEFCGLRIGVEPGVFVPRRRTEFLVHLAVDRTAPGAVVLDLCCGSGALGLALAAAVDGVELHAADVEAAAVRCARRNLRELGGHVYQGDLFAPLPPRLRGHVDVLLANVPYVPTAAIGLLPPEARDHEPTVALDGGADGLDVARRVLAVAADWLAPGGALLFETTEDQALQILAAVRAAGLMPETRTSERWESTAVIATRC